MNYMEKVAQMLGVELDEEFNIYGCDRIYKLTKYGIFGFDDYNQVWLKDTVSLEAILCGREVIIKKPILTKQEKEYLSYVIKPFRNQVLNICKYNIILCEYMYEQIRIQVKDGHDNGYTTIRLPIFKKGIMYKGMKSGKEYNVEDLEV